MISIELLGLLREIINDPKTLDIARLQENTFVRKRKMTFASAVCFMLDMRKTTLQTRLNMYFEYREEEEPMSQQAFSKLRNNFDHSPFVTMHKAIIEKEYAEGSELPLWNGYHILGVDGSYLQLPRTEELHREYGTHGQNIQCPAAGVSVLFDVMHGCVLDPIITTSYMSERAECENHIEFLKTKLPHIAQNSIVVIDRGYPSLDLLFKLHQSNMNFVARCNSMFLAPINRAPMGDSCVELKNGLIVRVIKFNLPTGETETLVTNLFAIPQDLFPELYALRWGVETAYFRFKRELCVEKFSGKTKNSILQDFWASMVLLNCVAVFQHEADSALHNRQEGKHIKHRNRARTSDLIVTLRDKFVFAVLCGNPMFGASEMERIIKTMARAVSPVRPNRSFPRYFRPHLVANANLKSHL